MIFIAFAIALLVVTNATLDSAERGVRESFKTSITGDVVIRPKYDIPLSLFGDETPFTGEFSTIPLLEPFEEIESVCSRVKEIASFVPILSGRAILDFYGDKEPCFVFGVENPTYLNFMSSLKISSGEPFKNGEEGVILPSRFFDWLKVPLGNEVQFVVADGLSSRIRSVPLRASFEYPSENSIFERLAILDADTLRELLSYPSTETEKNAKAKENSDLETEQIGNFDSLDSIDDLFSLDFSADFLTEIDEKPENFEERFFEQSPSSRKNQWNFLLLRTKKEAFIIKTLNKIFKERGYNVEAVSWRSAAGSSALYIYALRIILNAGIFVILLAGFVIVNNSLVVGILDRTREIGTMRALGASRFFVSFECMAETMILSCFAGLLGLFLGFLISRLLNVAHIPLSNPFLSQLFGADEFLTQISAGNLFCSFLVAAFLGLFSWFRPVFIALKVSPVSAMQGASR